MFKYMLLSDRMILFDKISKVVRNLINDDDLNNIVFRANLWDVKAKIEDILEKYKQQVGDKKEY